MITTPPLIRLEYNSHQPNQMLFDARDGMSDYKAIREVVERKGYTRYGFTPRPGELWLDLGANVGAFTVWAIAHGAKVVAFEPEPANFAMLKHNVHLNLMEDLCNLWEYAVMVDPPFEEATLSVNGARGNVWRSSLHHTWRGGTDVEVQLMNLRPFWIPEANVKMDVEGTEMPILEALAGEPVNRLVFEWSFDIDPSIERFRAVQKTLEATYSNVRGIPESRLEKDCAEAGRWQFKGAANSALIYCWN